MNQSERTTPLDDFSAGTEEHKLVDIVPTIEHVTYSDEGYQVTYLAPGKHFDINPGFCEPLETLESMAANGFAVNAVPIALVTLGKFPLFLFDRGLEYKERGMEPLVATNPNKLNTMVQKRFFVLGQEGFIQVGMKAGTQAQAENIRTFTEFDCGEEVIFGRSYSEETNTAYNGAVSAKHLSISTSRDGNTIRFIDLCSTNGTQIELRLSV